MCFISYFVGTKESFSATVDLPKMQFYGFLLPTLTYSSNEVESFSQPNASAFTAAGNPALTTGLDQSRATFQVAQSRFGFLVGDQSPVRGRLELDIIDFTKASPTTASVPRIRRAVIDYRMNDTDTLSMGQDWDILSPLAPHSYNLVGHYFESGDLAFMRQQLVWLRKTSQFEVATAIGLQTQNAGASDGNVELSKFPTFAFRTAFFPGPKQQVGVSAIASQILVDRVTDQKRPAYGATAFLELFFADEAVNFRTEVYAGRNLFNLGTLSLCYGNTMADCGEAGGWLTTRVKVSGSVAMFGGVGFAKVIDPSSMLSSYSVSSAGVYSIAGTGPGIEQNGTARFGFEHKPEKDLTLFIEGSYLKTSHHLLAADLTKFDPIRSALVTQAGMLFAF
jgi:hypothetical protein